MPITTAITCLFLYIGGVLLTNGWDHHARRANTHFNEIADCFISTCFVQGRKPDRDNFRLALDLAQTPPERIIYIEYMPLFVQVAEGLGIRGIQPTDYESTCRELAALGLRTDEGAAHESR